MRGSIAGLVLLVVFSAGCERVASPVSAPGAPGKGDSLSDLLGAPAATDETELKLFIAPSEQGKALAALGLSMQDAEQRWVSFYDTADLALYQSGLILRSRVKDGKTDDSTVKLRPMDPAVVDAAWFAMDDFKCETDRSVFSAVVSCSLSADQDEYEIEDVADGDRSVDKLFSKEQEIFISTYASVPVDWDQLVVMGPVDVKRWKIKQPDLAEKLTVERWELPDGTVLLEASTTVPSADAAAQWLELLSLMIDQGIDPTYPGSSKTRMVMDYYASAAVSD